MQKKSNPFDLVNIISVVVGTLTIVGFIFWGQKRLDAVSAPAAGETTASTTGAPGVTPGAGGTTAPGAIAGPGSLGSSVPSPTAGPGSLGSSVPTPGGAPSGGGMTAPSGGGMTGPGMGGSGPMIPKH